MTEVEKFFAQYTIYLRSGNSITIEVPCEIEYEQASDGTFSRFKCNTIPDQIVSDSDDMPPNYTVLGAIDVGQIEAISMKSVRNPWYVPPSRRSAGHEIMGSRRTRDES